MMKMLQKYFVKIWTFQKKKSLIIIITYIRKTEHHA